MHFLLCFEDHNIINGRFFGNLHCIFAVDMISVFWKVFKSLTSPCLLHGFPSLNLATAQPSYVHMSAHHRPPFNVAQCSVVQALRFKKYLFHARKLMQVWKVIDFQSTILLLCDEPSFISRFFFKSLKFHNRTDNNEYDTNHAYFIRTYFMNFECPRYLLIRHTYL